MKTTIPLEGEEYQPTSHLNEQLETLMAQDDKDFLEDLDYEEFLQELEKNLE
jgi:hypothetical protein